MLPFLTPWAVVQNGCELWTNVSALHVCFGKQELYKTGRSFSNRQKIPTPQLGEKYCCFGVVSLLFSLHDVTACITFAS